VTQKRDKSGGWGAIAFSLQNARVLL